MIIKSIDLFAGVGGLRIGLEKALKKLGLKHDCVLYSEINKHCQKTYEKNFSPTKLIEDIKSVKDIKFQIPNHYIILLIIKFFIKIKSICQALFILNLQVPTYKQDFIN